MQAQATKSNFQGYKTQHCGQVHRLEEGEEEVKTWWIGEKSHQFNLRLPWIDWHCSCQLSAEELKTVLLSNLVSESSLFYFYSTVRPLIYSCDRLILIRLKLILPSFHLTSNGVARVTAICFDPALIYCISFTHLHSVHSCINQQYVPACMSYPFHLFSYMDWFLLLLLPRVTCVSHGTREWPLDTPWQ